MMIFWIISSQDLQADWFLKEYEKEKSGRVRVAVPQKAAGKMVVQGTGSSVASAILLMCILPMSSVSEVHLARPSISTLVVVVLP